MLPILFTILSCAWSADSISTGPAMIDSSEPDSHYVLGNLYVSQGQWLSAAEQYVLSSRLHGNREVSRLQKIATLDTWMRKYTEAETWLHRGLAVEPLNSELTSDLRDLQARRSIHLYGSYGGDEIDYTRQAYQVGLFFGSVDWLDLYGSYSAADRVFFRRNTVSVDAYIFPTYSTYVRFGSRYYTYVYDRAATFPPDQNAYAKVPDLQMEIGQQYGIANSVSFEVEYFRPDFYWNPDVRTGNFKASATLRQAMAGPVYVRFLGALLRDPDPASFSTSPQGKIQSFRYEQLGLFGGGVGFDNGRIQVEMKYIPDRDLDRSLDWSVFGMARYEWDRLGIRYDILYDRYRSSASVTVVSPTVHMVSLQWNADAMLQLAGGAKVMSRTTTDLVPFIQFRYRTGGASR